MRKFSISALAIFVFGTSALKIASAPPAPTHSAGEARDGAFRDGLFHGALDAKRANPAHVAAGRWATEKDRNSYRAGYERAYASTVAAMTSSHSHPAESTPVKHHAQV